MINEAREILGDEYRTEAQTVRTITDNLLTPAVQALMGQMNGHRTVQDLLNGSYAMSDTAIVEEIFTRWNRALGVVRFNAMGQGLGKPFVEPRLHTRIDGRSDERDLVALDLTLASPDAAIRAAVARQYDVNVDGYIIVREANAIIVRPAAIYG